MAGFVLASKCRGGSLCHVRFLAVVSHDAVLGDFANINSHVGLSGNVKVGTGSFIGVGVYTRQGVSIGDWTIIGAGATVVRDIPSFCVACGVPAKPIRHYEQPSEMPAF